MRDGALAGRFTGKTDPLMERFNESLPFDKRMWAEDIRGSQAYAKALGKAGVLTQVGMGCVDPGTLARGLLTGVGGWVGGWVGWACSKWVGAYTKRGMPTHSGPSPSC